MKFTPQELEATGINTVKNDGESLTELRSYPSEHACRLQEPSKFVKFARKNGYITVGDKKVDVIFGIKKDGGSEIQAFRYPKAKWDAEDARKHCGEHDGSFEAAKGEEAGLMPSLEVKAIAMYTKAVEFARKCIKAGQINTEDKCILAEADRQALLRGGKAVEPAAEDADDNWENYGKHHLGVDTGKPAETRMHHTHPFAKPDESGKSMVYKKALEKYVGDKNVDIARTSAELLKTIHEGEE